MIFWFGNLTYSISIVSSLGDFLLGFDRYLAIKIPVKYNSYVGSKFAVFAFVICLAISTVNFVAIIFCQVPVTDHLVTFAMHVEAGVLYTHNIINESFAIANIVVTVMFLLAFKQFNRKISTNMFGINNHSTLSKVNRIVIYQMAAETLFVIIPILTTSIAQIGFNTNWPAMLGPYPSTLLAVYVMLCAILYRVKLCNQIDSAIEHSVVEQNKVTPAKKKVTFTLP
ncbi:hypothetical protein L596_023006 [Steinernema carpocapsae]|nr:hypothetical protein L596_023006 [Steinernema carpocapsae]